ncbi:MAG: hypothetical protein BWY80_00978 [Firmicutes bacterium ADurb.Bin456]|nr:MAG: hypothetical protein BWY80_00978 [Firmicutes bacterium ADurb.Bin456]
MNRPPGEGVDGGMEDPPPLTLRDLGPTFLSIFLPKTTLASNHLKSFRSPPPVRDPPITQILHAYLKIFMPKIESKRQHYPCTSPNISKPQDLCNFSEYALVCLSKIIHHLFPPLAWLPSVNVGLPIIPHCPPPRRGREEAAKRPGGGGVSAKGVPGDTPRQGRQGLSTNTAQPETPGQGRGMFHPPPRQPHPQGGDSP